MPRWSWAGGEGLQRFSRIQRRWTCRQNPLASRTGKACPSRLTKPSKRCSQHSLGANEPDLKVASLVTQEVGPSDSKSTRSESVVPKSTAETLSPLSFGPSIYSLVMASLSMPCPRQSGFPKFTLSQASRFQVQGALNLKELMQQAQCLPDDTRFIDPTSQPHPHPRLGLSV